MEGTVKAVGPGIRNIDGEIIPLAVKEGDEVIYGKYSGTEIKVDGETYLIMSQGDIFGIIRNVEEKWKTC